MNLPLVCVCVCVYVWQVTKGMQNLDVNSERGHGTIKAASSFDAETDAGVLRKAMKGFGKFATG